ncbi:hypothetical protein KKI24_11855 [bacterium]|nr:hypothetical protein [bacterium]
MIEVAIHTAKNIRNEFNDTQVSASLTEPEQMPGFFQGFFRVEGGTGEEWNIQRFVSQYFPCFKILKYNKYLD